MNDLRLINIETNRSALRLQVDAQGKLWQTGYGAKGAECGANQLAYPAAGDGWVFEPAIRVKHADGNTSTDLRVSDFDQNGHSTHIHLADPQYNFSVHLHFRTYSKEDVIECWTEIEHQEEGVVTLGAFASFSPDFGKADHWLTQFHGDWADEVNMAEEKLGFGIKILDSKLGVRAQQFRSPYFLLARKGPAEEDLGEVFGGALAWSGSFQFLFEKLPKGNLRANLGMNPYASAYQLKPGERFITPKVVMGWSNQGTGQLSRNLQRWTRQHALRDGSRIRDVVLNNWEATYFDFNEEKVLGLMDGGKSLGMELFLLDDGWFGRKFPRDDDSQGLGDWIPDTKKLPNGLSALTQGAKERGLRFGLWMEPEMVNPGSELFEAHPDWAIQQPKRELEPQRNQLVLDLTRPEVRNHVFQIVDQTLSNNPDISYVKWDCNRYVTQPGSTYLGSDEQSHLWIDYTWALYEIFELVAKKHPNVELMMCAGGGGRVDYGSLKYAHEFWPSDMTDPVRRIFIQWGYSHFFPAISMGCHVTDMGKRPIKFAFDVAMSGRLGMDMDVEKLTTEDRDFATRAIESYKGIREIVQLGDQFRLESPYRGARSSLMYCHNDEAVLFVFAKDSVEGSELKLKGLDKEAEYQIDELNCPGGLSSVHRGEELLAVGIDLPAFTQFSSSVYRLTRV